MSVMHERENGVSSVWSPLVLVHGCRCPRKAVPLQHCFNKLFDVVLPYKPWPGEEENERAFHLPPHRTTNEKVVVRPLSSNQELSTLSSRCLLSACDTQPTNTRIYLRQTPILSHPKYDIRADEAWSAECVNANARNIYAYSTNADGRKTHQNKKRLKSPPLRRKPLGRTCVHVDNPPTDNNRHKIRSNSLACF